jgi:hypothetical protein
VLITWGERKCDGRIAFVIICYFGALLGPHDMASLVS